LEKFNQELSYVKSFLKILLLSLDGSDQDSKLIKSRCLIYIGDLERYRVTAEKEKQWNMPWQWYEKAFALHPIGGIKLLKRESAFPVSTFVIL
jgi:hypothetical protein